MPKIPQCINGRSGFRWVEGEHPEHIRCTHIRTKRQVRAGERCHRARLRGGLYCYYHNKFHNKKPGNKGQPVTRLRGVSKFYQNQLSKTLDEVLNESLDLDPTKQTSILEELALFRAAAGPTVALFSGMHDLYSNAEPADKAKRLEQLIAVGVAMRDALSQVCSIAESANRINVSSAGRVSIAQLHFFTDQITRCAFEVFGDDPRVLTFNQMLKTQVKLPISADGGANGTNLTPDMDVMAMDATIPKYIDIDVISEKVT